MVGPVRTRADDVRCRNAAGQQQGGRSSHNGHVDKQPRERDRDEQASDFDTSADQLSAGDRAGQAGTGRGFYRTCLPKALRTRTEYRCVRIAGGLDGIDVFDPIRRIARQTGCVEIVDVGNLGVEEVESFPVTPARTIAEDGLEHF